MSQVVKIKSKFCACTGRFPIADFVKMIESMGYIEVKTGKTGGSRRKFCHRETKHLLMFHQPHGKELGAGTVSTLRNDLVAAGQL